MWLGWEAFMLYDLLWKLVIIFVVFVLYALLFIILSGCSAFWLVGRKQKRKEGHDEIKSAIEKAS
jgi:hypothetical protein